MKKSRPFPINEGRRSGSNCFESKAGEAGCRRLSNRGIVHHEAEQNTPGFSFSIFHFSLSHSALLPYSLDDELFRLDLS